MEVDAPLLPLQQQVEAFQLLQQVQAANLYITTVRGEGMLRTYPIIPVIQIVLEPPTVLLPPHPDIAVVQTPDHPVPPIILEETLPKIHLTLETVIREAEAEEAVALEVADLHPDHDHRAEIINNS